MRKRRPNSGFTLIELLIVVIIMGIIFALVAYSVSRMLPNMQMATASQQLLGAVGKARMLAVTKSAYVKLRLTPTMGSGGSSTGQDSIEILMQSPYDTLGWTGFNRVSITALSQGVKFNIPGTVEYNFWRDGSVEAGPASDPQIYCVNRPTTTKLLHVARATGIAEMNPGY
jgi:prepilin-type N-terminal cleavage/methylation domain-containing protein